MQKLIIISMLLLGACASQNPFIGSTGPKGPKGDPGLPGDSIVGPQGPAGTNGSNGSNGHSMVASSSSPSALVCPNGGSEVDFYIDLDDSYNVSVADSFQAASVACNGSNGANGTNGVDGTNGTNGSDGANGQDGLNGTNGQDGTNGTNGTNGQDGAQGPAGPQGPAGSGSTASIVAYTPATTCTLIYTGIYAQNHADNVTLHTLSTCSGASKVYTLSSSVAPYWIDAKVLAVYQPVSNTHNQVRVVDFN
jgi:hypothetical protein